MEKGPNQNPWRTGTWIAIGVLSVGWWIVAGEHSLQRTVLLTWLSLSSFVVGCLVGFLFSSYGEETNTVGKIRDWLVGGITALTVANGTEFKRIIAVFAAGPSETELAFCIGAALLYSGLGFFFMFFQRELIFNVLLAKSRAERDRVEGTQQAGQVIQRLLVRLPPSVLSGVDSVSEIPDVKDKEEQKLKDLIYSDEVEKFLAEAEDAAKAGAVDWDVVSKAAYISYYRTYFEKENRSTEIATALQWITRALIMNPMHVDLTTKYADMLSADEDYSAAAAVLDRLAAQPEAPLFVRQWQGYVLRHIANRLDESITLSEQYHSLFPDESDTYFNVAYAYANKYSEELGAARLPSKSDSANREKALSTLKLALSKQPDMLDIVRTKWTQPGEAFECMLHDPDFRAIVDLPTEKAAGGST